ncbi:MAG TPA: PLP-dependent aminotransferase family protein [Nocardioides sp.]|uniref:MocR-like pyridoxine biosynthesis transcription factor PdxR n=1 Tax=Nocardioides sp. TaxID=35761 RepID=UPI002E334E23|nr:PLP-dependent aminotransferase family protein [Nocardioides sp.]HEX5089051.1 PLP-dependent aminotransferase family protein [Nocardioides sp.]
MRELGDLVVDLSTRGDRATAVYRALLDAVRGGRLEPGERLPPTRALAVDLGVSRTTVATAYERLVAEGFLTARVGAGTFVADAARPVRPPRRGTDLAPRPGWDRGPHVTSGTTPKPAHDFRVGIPDARLFPFDTWRRLVTAELRVGAHDLGVYADPAGHLPLREAIARQLALSRGVTATPDEVLVTHGTQQALDLVARVLLAPGDVVAMEEPGYPLARDLFASYGAKVVPVRVDLEGLVVDDLPTSTRLVFTTPSHQFPTGPPLSLDRRHALLDFASRHRCAVVEDDYDSEFRFTERPLETLHSMDDAGRVLYLGTFSKSLVPGLRFGYLVAPEPLQAALRAALQLSVGYIDVPEQAALARFIADGLFARHLRKAKAAYAERRELVLEAVHGPLSRHLELMPCQAGLHVTTVLRDQAVDDAAVVQRAAALGIVVETLSQYAVSGGPKGIVMGYGATDPASIRPGLARLAALLDETSSTPAPPPR